MQSSLFPGRGDSQRACCPSSPVWVFLETGVLFSWLLLQVEVIKKAYMQGEVEFEDGENGEDGAASPRNVGHNIYILAHQVSPLLCLLRVLLPYRSKIPSWRVPLVLLFLYDFNLGLSVLLRLRLTGACGNLTQCAEFQDVSISPQ